MSGSSHVPDLDAEAINKLAERAMAPHFHSGEAAIEERYCKGNCLQVKLAAALVALVSDAKIAAAEYERLRQDQDEGKLRRAVSLTEVFQRQRAKLVRHALRYRAERAVLVSERDELARKLHDTQKALIDAALSQDVPAARCTAAHKPTGYVCVLPLGHEGKHQEAGELRGSRHRAHEWSQDVPAADEAGA